MYYDKDQSWARPTTAAAYRMPQGNGLQFAIDSGAAMGELISDIIVTDISGNCLTTNLGGLIAGGRLLLDLPLIGRREIEIRWIAGNRAGCRLITPMGEEELRDAVFEDDAIVDYFPGLRGYGSSVQWGHA